MLVYMCACLSSSNVSGLGLRLHLTHHLSRPHPTNMPCRWEDAAGALVVSRAGQDARVSAGPLSAVAWRGTGPTGLAGPRLGVGGPLGLGLPWCGRLPVEPAGLRHGTLGRLHCGCRRSTFGLSSALFWVRPRLSLRWFLLGVPCPGGPRMLGPGSFPCLLHALRDGAVDPHTHY